MSRHVIQESPFEVVVGWDQPLLTFFGIVYAPEPQGQCEDKTCEVHEILGPHQRKTCEDNEPTLWVGCRPEELYEVDDLVRAMGKYRNLITYEMRVTLYGDKDEGR